jgi:hypothetical protein
MGVIERRAGLSIFGGLRGEAQGLMCMQGLRQRPGDLSWGPLPPRSSALRQNPRRRPVQNCCRMSGLWYEPHACRTPVRLCRTAGVLPVSASIWSGCQLPSCGTPPVTISRSFASSCQSATCTSSSAPTTSAAASAAASKLYSHVRGTEPAATCHAGLVAEAPARPLCESKMFLSCGPCTTMNHHMYRCARTTSSSHHLQTHHRLPGRQSALRRRGQAAAADARLVLEQHLCGGREEERRVYRSSP